jgi:hypothetical protein
MRIQLHGFLFLMTAILAGCMTGRVQTNNVAFYQPDFTPLGTIWVIAADAEVNSSLEFATYKRKIEEKLSIVGYEIASSADRADHIAFVAYGIDTGESATRSTPVFGQTGGGTTYSSGTANTSEGSIFYSGSTYSMPTYGVVGSVNQSVAMYNRVIALDIVGAASLRDGAPQKIYEGRTTSTGSCGVITEVFDEMLDAMFQGFPGENGRNRRLVVPGTFNC